MVRLAAAACLVVATSPDGASAVRKGSQVSSAVVHSNSSTLPECMSLPTYHYKDPETGSYRTPCMPSKHAGAFYSDDAKKVWQCWGEETDQKIRNDAGATAVGFTGACEFKDHTSELKPEDAPECSKMVPDCNPGPPKVWGACFSSTTDKWIKIKASNTKEIANALKGDCKAQSLRDDKEDHFYDGVCRFKEEEKKFYKCDTLPTWNSKASSTCGNGGNFHSACFSLEKGAHWSCHKDTLTNEACATTPRGDQKGTYSGTCYFSKAGEEYEAAEDGTDVGLETTTTTTAETEEQTDAETTAKTEGQTDAETEGQMAQTTTTTDKGSAFRGASLGGLAAAISSTAAVGLLQ
eukprot:TRINITY_DN8640_c0_g2_i1.p1 TRINITY_DN8640_c0_g2~~TRINITY_DN8640_c0_g2_i1.p1  ORF type:complete len:350 (+),score=94.26 TRINITY_DN8640_c0_g2_i1:84-1133(+)